MGCAPSLCGVGESVPDTHNRSCSSLLPPLTPWSFSLPLFTAPTSYQLPQATSTSLILTVVHYGNCGTNRIPSPDKDSWHSSGHLELGCTAGLACPQPLLRIPSFAVSYATECHLHGFYSFVTLPTVLSAITLKS